MYPVAAWVWEAGQEEYMAQDVRVRAKAAVAWRAEEKLEVAPVD
mgnify:CR=1 FL=1